MRFFDRNVFQYDNMSFEVNADEKLNGIVTMKSSRLQREEADRPINEIQQKRFALNNATVVWLGITVSPFCAEIASHLRQLALYEIVRDHGAKRRDYANGRPSRRSVNLKTPTWRSLTNKVGILVCRKAAREANEA